MACAVSFQYSEGDDGEQAVISVNDTVIPSEVINRSALLRELVWTGTKQCDTSLPMQPEAFMAWAAFIKGNRKELSIEDLAVIVQVWACSLCFSLSFEPFEVMY
jgi:hypothetical protein